jgi:hypothetical protein
MDISTLLNDGDSVPGQSSICNTCRNLDFSRFKRFVIHTNGAGRETFDDSKRYLVVEFRDLRASAATGCLTCDIITQVANIFWGDKPEEYNSVDWVLPNVSDDESTDPQYPPRTCCLYNRLGKSLVMFRTWQRDHTSDSSPGTNELHSSVEIFTKPGMDTKMSF